jgi:Ca2+-binding RTX toxin-like protein
MDIIIGGGGNGILLNKYNYLDIIYGLNGDDILHGSAGDDKLFGD